jgi:diacylglycerol kinase family enzyme
VSFCNLDEIIENNILDEIVKNNIYVILNPKAGNRALQNQREARERLGTNHIIYYVSSSKEDLIKMVSWLAAEAEKKQSVILVLIVAGDGGYDDAINAEGDLSRLILGITDAGSSSDFAKTLNMRRFCRTFNLINALLEGEVNLEDCIKPIDLMRISYTAGNQEKATKALNLFSMGFDGEICKLVNDSAKVGGVKKKKSFVSAAIKVLKHYAPIDVEYTINNDSSRHGIAKNVLTYVVMHGEFAASGMRYNPYFELGDGFAEAIIAKHRSIPSLLTRVFHLKVLKDSQHIDSPPGKDGYNSLGIRHESMISSINLQVLNVNGKGHDYFETDGEHHCYDPAYPLRLEVLPKATTALYIPHTPHGSHILRKKLFFSDF